MLPVAQTFSKNDIFALIPTLPEMGSIQSQHGLRSQNANRMLTLFRKICFDGKNSQSLVPTVKTPETPVKSRVSGVLKGAGKRSKCSKRHPLPRTRNQFAGNRTRVRIPPAAPSSGQALLLAPNYFIPPHGSPPLLFLLPGPLCLAGSIYLLLNILKKGRHAAACLPLNVGALSPVATIEPPAAL